MGFSNVYKAIGHKILLLVINMFVNAQCVGCFVYAKLLRFIINPLHAYHPIQGDGNLVN